MAKENHTKGELSAINKLRATFGLSPLPPPGKVTCPMCLKVHHSQNPTSERFCPACRNSTVFKAGLQ